MPAAAWDVVVVGGGHNALVAAALLGHAGHSVLLLERRPELGGAAVSARAFEGIDAKLSRYAYLVSLFPSGFARQLGIEIALRRRRIESCTPDGDTALVVGEADEETERSFAASTGSGDEHASWTEWQHLTARIAAAVAPTLTRPLAPASEIRSLVGPQAFSLLAGRPLGESLREAFASDLVRGIVCTDGLIGTFAHSSEPSLRQNRCWLYHVIGNGTGRWDVPVGGMGAISEALAACALAAGAELRTSDEVVSIEADGRRAEVRTAGGERHLARVVLCGAAPAVLDRLLARSGAGPARRGPPPPEGSQVKVNMLVSRLPRLSCGVHPGDAFAGTLHVNERLSQLDRAFGEASAGELADPLPCEVYCHTLSDPSILSAGLRAAGVHSLTAFALHTPARLFSGPDATRNERAGAAVLDSLQSVLAEPLADCLLTTPEGRPCVEVHTPADLERDLAMPGGHIFHGDLRWPWAEGEEEVGTWGVETEVANVLVCGSGARRGGAVSGIGGHNAAMAALGVLAGHRRSPLAAR